jgi:hypothetical protein
MFPRTRFGRARVRRVPLAATAVGLLSAAATLGVTALTGWAGAQRTGGDGVSGVGVAGSEKAAAHASLARPTTGHPAWVK